MNTNRYAISCGQRVCDRKHDSGRRPVCGEAAPQRGRSRPGNDKGKVNEAVARSLTPGLRLLLQRGQGLLKLAGRSAVAGEIALLELLLRGIILGRGPIDQGANGRRSVSSDCARRDAHESANDCRPDEWTRAACHSHPDRSGLDPV